ncbi:cation efflux protein [Suillus lakei]|nr:cation efflux protein [Suillus lakei]
MKLTTKLSVVLVISVLFFATEIAIGFHTKSLALIADAFHYLNDIIAYALAFLAARLQEKGKRTPEFSYAFHRGELLGAFFNGVFLLALAFSIFLQAIERFVDVQPIDKPVYILIVGCVGFTLNVVSAIVIQDHGGHSHGTSAHTEELAHSDINLATMPPQAADGPIQGSLHTLHNHTSLPKASSQTDLGVLGVLIHLLGDAVNNIGVIISAIIVWKVTAPSRFYADPAVSMMISFIIFGSAIPLTSRSGRILLEAAPANLNLQLVKEDLLKVPGVLSIHDLHVWQLSQSIVLASFHVRVSTDTNLANWEHTEETLQQCCAAYGISHVTIAPEIEHERLLVSGCGAGNARARAACDDGFGCPADDAGLLRMRKRAGGSV